MGDAGKRHFIGRFVHVVLFDFVVILALGQIVNFFKAISSVAYKKDCRHCREVVFF